MCGRYSLTVAPETLRTRFDAPFPDGFEPRYNSAPGQELSVVLGEASTDDVAGRTEEGSSRRVARMRWGFTPEWADESFDLINARAETLREKRSFETAVERRRCLVPADGYYEWVESDDGKRPYRFALEDDRPFAMAGVWERWRPPTTQTGLDDFGDAGPTTDAAVETFAVVTTRPNDLVADLHDRMPALLSPDAATQWLDTAQETAADVVALLDPYPPDQLRAYPVSTRLNDPTNDDPSLVEPVEG